MEGANNGKMKQSATSSRVMLTSPIGRWKLLVYLCHLSTNADISPQSLMSTEHAIKGLSHVAATRSSISRACLPNFYTFLLWEDNFNSRRSSPFHTLTATWSAYSVSTDGSRGPPGNPSASSPASALGACMSAATTGSSSAIGACTSAATTGSSSTIGAASRCLLANAIGLRR